LAKLFNWFVRGRAWYFALPRFKFEATTLGLELLFGLLLMPALIFVAGYFMLKPYANGGLFSFYFDFFKGLFELRPAFWSIVAGPPVFVSLFRAFRWILRKL
jgi:hypothetical protein